MNSSYQHKQGFSLIELIAIISMVAILTAIMIPIIDSAQNTAKTTKSLSNLRQIASAMQLYSADNKGMYPIGYHNPDPGNEIYWYLEIAEYLDHKTVSNLELNNILISPFAESNAGLGYHNGEVRTTPSTYSVHGVICPSVPSDPELAVEDMRMPVWNVSGNHSEIILVGEGVLSETWGISNAVFSHPSEWQGETPSEGSGPVNLNAYIDTAEVAGSLSYRANGHTLVAFLDGHVESMLKGTVKYRNIVANP